VWFGFLALCIALPFFVSHRQNAAFPIPLLLIPTIMAVVGFFVMKKLVFDLADEVWEDGETLMAKNGSRRRYKERQLFAVYESSSGDAVVAAADGVW
jgi:hypothetical protein